MCVCVCVCMYSLAKLCLTLCNPMDCSPPCSSVHGIFPGKNTGVGSLSLLQGIFPTQGSNPGLLHCRHIVYQLSHQGSPNFIFGLMNKCTVFVFGHKERRKQNFIFCLPECTQNSVHETKENVKVIYFFRINFPKLSCLKQQRFLNSQILRAGKLGTA